MAANLEPVTFGDIQELQEILANTDEPVLATADDGAQFVAMSVAAYEGFYDNADMPSRINEAYEHARDLKRELENIKRLGDGIARLVCTPSTAKDDMADNAIAADAAQSELLMQAPAAPMQDLASPGDPYMVAELPYTPIDADDYQRSTYNDAIVDRMRKVMQAEAPVERQRLFNTVRASFGIKRSGQDIQSQNEWLMNRRLEFKTTEFNGATFLWLPDQDPETYDIFRTVAEGSERQVSEIPYEELANAIMAALGLGVALSRDELIDAAMRLLGYKRRTNRVREVLGTAIERAAEEDRIRLFTDGTFRSSRR